MKKFIATFLVFSMLVSATACSSETPGPQNTAGTNNPPVSENSGTTPPEEDDFTLEGPLEGELNISTYETMSYEQLFAEAAEKFEAKYPGTKVNVHTFSTPPEIKTVEKDGVSMAVVSQEPDPQAENDYIFKAGNDIMSGQGADIYAMDILPYYKYIQGGYLEDLTKYFKADSEINLDNYANNILDAAKYDGKQYIIPLDYGYSLFMYNKAVFGEDGGGVFKDNNPVSFSQAIDASTDLVDAYNAQNPDAPIGLMSLDKLSYIMEYVNNNYKSLVDHNAKTAHFDTPEFRKMVEKTEELTDKGYLETSVYDMGEEEFSFEDFEARMSVPYSLSVSGHYDLLNTLLDENHPMNMSMNIGGANSGAKMDLGGLMASDDGSVQAYFSHVLGVNANSQNKRLAWEFIKFMLSDEMQNSLNIYSLPVNNNALYEKAKLEVTGELYMPEDQRQNAELTEEQQALLDEYMDLLTGISAKVNGYTPVDTTIYAIIHEEMLAYAKGDKPLDDALSAIQSKVTLYLNE